VNAALVKQLRDLSGAPMMDCKKALAAEDVKGDLQKAMDWLRAKGKARAASNADRVAAEGVVAVYSNKDNSTVTLVEVNSETDFVSRNNNFQAFVASIAATANKSSGVGAVNVAELMSKPTAAGTSVQDALSDIITVIRENIVIKRVLTLGPGTSGKTTILSNYVHGRVGVDSLPENVQMGKAVCVVSMGTTASDAAVKETVENIGKKLAMHVVASNPAYLSIADVPKDVLDRETAISLEQAQAEGKAKNEEIMKKIVAGKVQKRLGEICLLTQNHMAEEGSPVVSKYLSTVSSDLKVSVTCDGFIKWTLSSSESK
jgi:elongation factor Ts